MRFLQNKQCEDILLTVKKNLKNFNRELNNLYITDQFNNKNDIYKIRRNSHILETVIKRVSNVDLKAVDASDKKKKKEIKDLYKKAKDTLDTLEELLKNEYYKDVRSGSDNNFSVKKNLDNLKIANQELRKFDLTFGDFNE